MKPTVNVAHISYSESQGGASRAAKRIHKAIQSRENELGFISDLYVIEKTTNDPRTRNLVEKNIRSQTWQKIHPRIAKLPTRSDPKNSKRFLSVAWPDTGIGKRINKMIEDGLIDIVHLHWLGNSTISIEEIGRIKCPIIWTLHDQWAFSGAEHYKDASTSEAGNYQSSSKIFSGLIQTDIESRTLKRKLENWKRTIHAVCPSNWMSTCAQESPFGQKWNIHTIPYPIDTNIWKPADKSESRKILGLPTNRKIILFGALGGSSDLRKGADLVKSAIRIIRTNSNFQHISNHTFCIFGENCDGESNEHDTTFLGHLTDDVALRLAYSAADVMVVPSRIEAFGQTASEAQACGTPAVGFQIGGLLDAVDHLKTGSLAEPYDPLSLAESIRWTIESDERHETLCAQSRERAVQLWSQSTIAEKYAQIYRDSLQG